MSVFQWGGTIQFGLIPIPVRAKGAVKTDAIAFQMLHNDPECHGAAGYSQDWGCKDCGEKIARTDTVKGWKGIPVDKEYLDSLKAEKSKVIEIDGLVPAEQIDPRYYESSYDVTPEEGGEKAYVLFAKLLERSGRVAIGKAVLGDREQIVTIRPRDGILAMEVMYWPDDLTRAGRDQLARERTANIQISDAEMAMGDMLVASMSKDFDPTQFKNLYVERVREYLATVEAGEAAPVAPKPVEAKSGGLDLLAQLTASLAAAAAPKEEAAVA